MKNENKIFKVGLTVAALTLSSMMSMGAMAGTTLDNVKKKGFVQCGISDGLPGFSYTDPKGNFHGFDVDVCRAVAAAVFPCLLYTSPSPRD